MKQKIFFVLHSPSCTDSINVGFIRAMFELSKIYKRLGNLAEATKVRGNLKASVQIIRGEKMLTAL